VCLDFQHLWWDCANKEVYDEYHLKLFHFEKQLNDRGHLIYENSKNSEFQVGEMQAHTFLPVISVSKYDEDINHDCAQTIYYILLCTQGENWQVVLRMCLNKGDEARDIFRAAGMVVKKTCFSRGVPLIVHVDGNRRKL